MSSHASTASFDTLLVSTITGQIDGIYFTPYVGLSDNHALTLHGPNGYLTAASSVNASAFFGDAKALTGLFDSILSATQAFSGSNTFESSFTVQSGGREITLSTGATNSNIRILPDGISFSPELHNSSSTVITQSSTGNPLLGECVGDSNGTSTITVRTAGGRVEIIFSGMLRNDQYFAGGVAAASFLQDGSFADQLSPTNALVWAQDNQSEGVFTGSFHYIVSPAAGVHSYCLTIASPALGNTYVCNQPYNPSHTDTAPCDGRNIFYVKEIK